MVFHSKNSNPTLIFLDSSEVKADIAQLVQWIGSAKSMGYEKPSSSKMSKGTTELVIKLDNHNEMDISEAWLPATVTEANGKVVSVLKRSNKYVDIHNQATLQVLMVMTTTLLVSPTGRFDITFHNSLTSASK